MKFDFRPDHGNSRLNLLKRRNPLRFASVFASFVVHTGIALFLVRNDIMRPRHKDIEAIPIELVTNASLEKIDTQRQSNQTSAEKGENSQKQSQIESLQNKPVKQTVDPQDENPVAKVKPEAVASPEPKKDHEDPKSPSVKSKPQIHRELSDRIAKEVAKPGKIARNEAKTFSKSENLNNPPSSPLGGQISSSANAGKKPLSGSFTEPFTEGAAKVSLPDIPFDPEIFRAVAVPLPSAEGVERVSYKEIVFGLLERAKHYPETALARGAKGVAIVEFLLDSAGTVIQRSLLQSSGEPDLDTESLDLVDRASPFPPPPIGAQHSFSAEIGFGLPP